MAGLNRSRSDICMYLYVRKYRRNVLGLGIYFPSAKTMLIQNYHKHIVGHCPTFRAQNKTEINLNGKEGLLETLGQLET